VSGTDSPLAPGAGTGADLPAAALRKVRATGALACGATRLTVAARSLRAFAASAALAIGAWPVLAVATSPGRASPPCEARVELEPTRAFVGEAVLHRRLVIHPESLDLEWTRPLAFPGFRAETTSIGTAVRTVRDGEPAVRIEVPTWLFAARPGAWVLPAGRLRCGDHEIEVTSPRFEARPWPEAGRPPDFTGVVGRVSVDAAAEPEVALGGAVRVHVTSRGPASLWNAAPSLRVSPAETEIFAREPRIRVDDAGGQPRVVRHDAFDLVPRRMGTLRIEPLRIPHLNPAEARYQVAQTDALEIRVGPAPGPASEPTPPGLTDRPPGQPAAPTEPAAPAALTEPAAPAAPAVPTAWLVAAGLGLAGLVAIASARRRRGTRADPVREALRAFDRAGDTDARTAALERALRARLAEAGREPGRRPTRASLERFPDASLEECRRALAELERARFGGADPGAEFDARLEAIRTLLARTVAP